MNVSSTPALSVVLLTPAHYNTLRRTIAHLAAQNVRGLMEIVIVAPQAEAAQPDEAELSVFHSWQIVEVGRLNSTTHARAAGVRAAAAPVVAFGEDHSFPQPGWAQALLEAHQGPWAVVGPAVQNANPASAASWANFLIEYGHWLAPAQSGERRHLPGHNSAYKRDILLAYGDALPAMLDAETVLHWDMRAQGHRLYLEARAVTRHLNPSRLLLWAPNRFRSGWSFAGPRARRWPLPRRLFYTLGAFSLPLRDGLRIVGLVRRAGLGRQLLPRILPALFFNLTMDGLGRAMGYAFGFQGRDDHMLPVEFQRVKYLNAGDRQAETRHRANPAL